MQFKNFLSGKKVQVRSFDCASCRGKNRKCLFFQRRLRIDQIDYDSSGKKTWYISSIEDLNRYIDHVQSICSYDLPEIDAVLLVKGTDVCPIPFFTPLSIELLKMVQFCGDSHFPYPGGYLDQLLIYVDAYSVIRAEENACQKRTAD